MKCPIVIIYYSSNSQDSSYAPLKHKMVNISPLFTFPLNPIYHFSPPLTLFVCTLRFLIKIFNAYPFRTKTHSLGFLYLCIDFQFSFHLHRSRQSTSKVGKSLCGEFSLFCFFPPSSLVCLVQIAFSPIMYVRLNLFNHLIGFIPCQICLYFSI